MLCDRVLVRDPEQRSPVIDDWVMDDAILLRDFDALEPLRKTFRDVFLPEPLLADPRRVTFHRDRPPAQVRQDDGRHGVVVRRKIAFSDPVVGEQYLLGMCDHGCFFVTSRACSISFSGRTPSSRGCLSLPCTVHSINAACTTISGRAQCARSFGKPVAFVNGDFGSSIASSRLRRSSRSFVSKPVPSFPAKTRSLPS